MVKKSIYLILLCLAPFATAVYAQKSPFDTPSARLFECGEEFFHKKDYSAADRYFSDFEAANKDKYSENLRQARKYRALCSFYLRRDDARLRLENYCNTYTYTYDVEDAEMCLGILDFEDGKYKQALRRFDEVDASKIEKPLRMELMFYKGYSYIKQGSWQAAADEFAALSAMSENKYTSQAYYYNAFANYKLGNYTQALEDFYKIENDGDFPDVPYLICLCLYSDGDCTSMKQRAGKLISDGDIAGHSELLRLMGVCSYLSQDYADAVSYMSQYREAVKKMSREDWYVSGIACYNTGQWKDAVDYLSKAVAKTDDGISQNSCFHIANAYMQIGDSANARISYEAASRYKNDPRLTEDAMYNYAVLTYESGFSPFNETISAFERFISAFPQSEHIDKIYECLVSVYLTTNNYAAAYKSLQNIKTDNPIIKSAEERILYGMATDAIADRKYSAAMKNLRKIVEAPVTYNAEVKRKSLFWYAECLYKSKKYDEASRYYKAYISDKKSAKDKDFPMALYGLAYTAIRMNDYSAAVQSFNRFCTYSGKIEDKSLLVDACNRVGDCLFYQRDYAGASKAYDKANGYGSDLHGTDYSVYRMAIISGLRKKYGEKISILQKLLTRYPSSDLVDDAMYEMARAYMESGDNPRAIAVLEDICTKYKRANPIVRKARLQIAMLQYNSGDLQNAVDNFKLIVSTYPKSEEAATALSTLEIIMVDNNRVEEFNAIAKSAGRTSAVKEDSLSYKACERIYFKNDFKTAVPNFEKYLKNYPDGKYASIAKYYLANCYLQTGDKAKSLQLYKSIADDPANPNLQLTLQRAAAMSYENGDYKPAVGLYQSLLETGDAETRSEARSGILRCAYKLNDWPVVRKAADAVITEGNPNSEIIPEARYYRLKAGMAMDSAVSAMLEDVEFLAADTRSAYGAEAKYLLMEHFALAKDYARAESEFFDFVEKGTPHFYWLAKAFLLVSDVYVEQGKYFEAKQYLQSLKDNYADMESDIADGLAKRMKAIEKHEKENVSE